MMYTRKQYERDSQQAIAEVQQIGARLARTIMESVYMTGNLGDIDKGLEGAVANFRKLLVEGGVCDHDVEVSIDVLRRSIIAEGKSIAIQTHDVGRTIQ